ncbi:MAG: hypothetical protein AAFV53_37335 [Myxococcota bacterium]
MPKRTRPKDTNNDLRAEDLDNVVQDKRAAWRADAARARRRNRRYQRMITDHLLHVASAGDED